jgi:hypothetical protein
VEGHSLSIHSVVLNSYHVAGTVMVTGDPRGQNRHRPCSQGIHSIKWGLQLNRHYTKMQTVRVEAPSKHLTGVAFRESCLEKMG